MLKMTVGSKYCVRLLKGRKEKEDAFMNHGGPPRRPIG